MKRLEHIQNLLDQGENSSVEFKRQEVHPDAIAREMVAFANTRGGTILIGVEDTGTIAGMDDGMFHYDLTPVEKTSIKDLNIPRISSYFQRYNIDVDVES